MKFRSCFDRRPDRDATALADSRAFPLSSLAARIAPHYVFGLDAASPPLHLFPSSLPLFCPNRQSTLSFPIFTPSTHFSDRPTDWIGCRTLPPSPSGGSHWRLHSPINYPQGFLNHPRSAAESSPAPTWSHRWMDPSKVKSRCHVARSFFLPSPMEFPLERPGRPALTHSRGG